MRQAMLLAMPLSRFASRISICPVPDQSVPLASARRSPPALSSAMRSSINVAGAVALGRELGGGTRVATILADTGFRYLSTLFNPAWLEEKGLPVFDWLKLPQALEPAQR